MVSCSIATSRRSYPSCLTGHQPLELYHLRFSQTLNLAQENTIACTPDQQRLFRQGHYPALTLIHIYGLDLLFRQLGLNLDWLTLSLASAIFLFVLGIFLLGPIFCSWICPVGTCVDGADKGIEKFMPNLNKKREERQKQKREKNKKKSKFVCPTCPFGKFLANKTGMVANGILIGALAGSALLRFPIWCSICPIGIMSQGMFHLKSVTRISSLSGFSNISMPVLIELWIFPVIAVLLSLREKRFWCRIICPLGALVRFFAKFNPFFKPTVKTGKQVMKQNFKTGEGNRLVNCAECTKMDQRACESVCPQGIGPLKAKGSAECTKCLECYVECENDMIGIKWYQTPDVVLWLRRFFNKLKKQQKKQKNLTSVNS